MEKPKIEIRKSTRAKYMSLSVGSDMTVVLTVPWFFDPEKARRFLESKTGWLTKKLALFKKRFPEGTVVLKSTRSEFLERRAEALQLVKNKIEFWNQRYGFKYNRLGIKNQKTRWGSCSKKGNLNFSFQVVNLPPSLVDYLVVHELCHLKEFNHSKNFWHLVSFAVPDYKVRRKEMRKYLLRG
jgi:predicted metal-dependent hydrolase